jgi:hypothetical protein
MIDSDSFGPTVRDAAHPLGRFDLGAIQDKELRDSAIDFLCPFCRQFGAQSGRPWITCSMREQLASATLETRPCGPTGSGMAGKKMEGDEEQLRRKAREAKRQGQAPSEAGVTRGASKQRRHLPADESHARKLHELHRGKQPDPGQHVSRPQPRPGSRD